MNKLEIALKWKSTRDSVKKFFLIDKEKGKAEYAERMNLLQGLIKNHSAKNELTEIQSVIKIAGEQDGMMALQILAAGYELVSGKDFTEINDKK